MMKSKTLIGPPIRLSQMTLVGDILEAIGKQQKNIGLEPRLMNACIFAANHIVKEFGRESVMATPGMGLKAWLASDDTGLSSLFMAHVLSGHYLAQERVENADHPRDSDDFGRCVRFLEAVNIPTQATSLSPSIQTMRPRSPHWNVLVAHWDELTALYKEGKHQECTSLMRQLLDAIK